MSTSNQLTIREKQQQLVTTIKSDDFGAKLKTLLGPTVPVAKFQQVTALALQQTPDLANKDRGSLLLACLQAAKSKLVPDGKQGALVTYGNQVQWQVMIAGLRVLLARQGFDLRTEIVCENDTFDYVLGDEPKITHSLPKTGVRGHMIGAYAIARGPDGRLYRRYMTKDEIDYVRSKAKAGNVWNTWYNPMAEKTVGRALVKQLPIYDSDDDLRAAIAADDATFDLGRPEVRTPSAAAAAVAAAARGQQPAAADDVIEGTATEVVDAPGDGQVVEADPLAGGAPGDDVPF